MKNFLHFLNEDADEPVSQDTSGKLHELLTGYHLNGGKHMEKHPDKNSESPKQVHDRLKASISKEQYAHINHKAKSAAEDIRSKIETKDHKIHSVAWTSKPGDIHRATGIHSSQKEDPSDIVATTKNKAGKTHHHGISLKVSSNKDKNIPVANPGIESTLGGEKILERHRNDLRKRYSKINSSPAERREHMKKDHKMAADIKKRNLKTLRKIAGHTASQLRAMHPQHLANHIRKHVLAAKLTPMQQQGHSHMRHTTYVHNGKILHHSMDPAVSHEHLLKDHANLSVRHEGATRISFQHKGKTFASQRFKFSSQSDPLSAVKGTSNTVGNA